MDKYTANGSSATLANIVNELKNKGYNIKTISAGGSSVTGINLENSKIKMTKNATSQVVVNFEGAGSGSEYYAEVSGKYYKINLTNNGVTIDKTATTINESEESDNKLKAEVKSGSTGTGITIGTISGNTIPLTSSETATGTTTLVISYGSYSKECEIAIVVTPTESSTASTSVSFSTNYGKIDVIWLKDDTNTVNSAPNDPNLYTGENALKPVYWASSAEGNVSGTAATDVVEVKSTDSGYKAANWYNYSANRWANATNSDGSYFVWIPRFAYRISYYSVDWTLPANSEATPTGYYDGYGMWKAEDGSVKYKLEDGIETVEYQGDKYIVHPAFTKDDDVIYKKDSNGNNTTEVSKEAYDLGGWNKELTGFWVAKYEMSRSGASASSAGSGYNTTFLSLPNVQSARSISIGDMYQVSRSYDSNKESHLMKNSEWGAVAYLTHSQYGRNGTEIDINNSSSYITGNGGGSPTASSASGTKYAYNTANGIKASSTGNISGIYDLSGGAWEQSASYNKASTSRYLTDASYGYNMTKEAKNGDNYISTKYVTAYKNGTSTFYGTTIYTIGKTGDATKETYEGAGKYSWNSDYAYFAYSGCPFFYRGGGYSEKSIAGVFYSYPANGESDVNYGFRVVLAK